MAVPVLLYGCGNWTLMCVCVCVWEREKEAETKFLMCVAGYTLYDQNTKK
jgi:hypothetical protein